MQAVSDQQPLTSIPNVHAPVAAEHAADAAAYAGLASAAFESAQALRSAMTEYGVGTQHGRGI